MSSPRMTRRVRALSPPERAMEILQQRLQAFNIVMASRVRLPLEGATVQQALNMLQQRHPHLRYQIVWSGDRPYFEEFPSQTLPKLPVQVLRQADWQTVVEAELNRGFASDDPLMRVTVIPGLSPTDATYLIMTLHHAIADGVSSLNLHLELLTYCQHILQGGIGDLPPNLAAIPPLETLLPGWRQSIYAQIKGWWFLLRSQVRIARHRPESLAFEQHAPFESRDCGLVHTGLSPALTQQLIQTARQAQTTVQGALCAAMLLAVAQAIAPMKDRTVPVNCQSYVDLRRQLKPTIDQEHLGMLASAMLTFHTIEPATEFWELARQVKHQLDAGLKRQKMFDVATLFPTIVETYLACPDAAPATVALTNLGRIDLPDELKAVVEDLHFAVGQRVYGGIFAAAAATCQSRMTLNFLFSQPTISRETARAIAHQVTVYLEMACRQATGSEQIAQEAL